MSRIDARCPYCGGLDLQLVIRNHDDPAIDNFAFVLCLGCHARGPRVISIEPLFGQGAIDAYLDRHDFPPHEQTAFVRKAKD